MDVFQNMELFSELIQCGGNIYTWCYNADGSLLQSNCPEAGFLSGAFEIFGCKKKMLDYGSRHSYCNRDGRGYDNIDCLFLPELLDPVLKGTKSLRALLERKLNGEEAE